VAHQFGAGKVIINGAAASFVYFYFIASLRLPPRVSRCSYMHGTLTPCAIASAANKTAARFVAYGP
jgi:hypothetical protein